MGKFVSRISRMLIVNCLLLLMISGTNTYATNDSSGLAPQNTTPQNKISVNVLHYLINTTNNVTPVCPAGGAMMGANFISYGNNSTSGILYFNCTEDFWQNDPYYLALADTGTNFGWVLCSQDSQSTTATQISGTYCSIQMQAPPFVQIIGLLPQDSMQTSGAYLSFSNMTFLINTANSWQLVGSAVAFTGSSTAPGSGTNSQQVQYLWQYDNSANPQPPPTSSYWNLGWQITSIVFPPSGAPAGAFSGPQAAAAQQQTATQFVSGAFDLNSHWGNYSCGPYVLTITPNMMGKICYVTCDGYWDYEQNNGASVPNVGIAGDFWRGFKPTMTCTNQ